MTDVENAKLSWQETGDKLQRQFTTVPKEWQQQTADLFTTLDEQDVLTLPPGLLSPKEAEITATSVSDLLSNLSSGTWSSVEVATAFMKRTLVAHKLTNCVTEFFFDKALERANFLDDHLKTTGKPLGPFHGLPISLKDMIDVEGVESTIGYVAWIGNVAPTNSVIVDVLESAGAVMFCKTNIPQTLMWMETYNHIFGRTVNPYNRSLTSGGSSGGEGALIAMKGSVLGIGSDLGGSNRIPAAFCGLYGLRPSVDRLPFTGIASEFPGAGQDSVPPVPGPISSSLDGIKLFMKGILSPEIQPWSKDPFILNKAWDEDAYLLKGKERKLCFAVIWDDEVVQPHPPVLRALNTTKEALEEKGHKVIDWEPFQFKELIETMMRILYSCSPIEYTAPLRASGEPRIESMDPAWTPTEARAPPQLPPPTSANDLWRFHALLRQLRKEYLDHWQKSVDVTGTGRPIDAIIMPTTASAAGPHGKNSYAEYTRIWNALDYPAISIPVTKVDPELDPKAAAPAEFHSDQDKMHYELYTPELYKNAPVGVQLVAPRLQEEALIGMAEVVDKALKAI